MQAQRRSVAVVLLALAVLAAGCSSSKPSTTARPKPVSSLDTTPGASPAPTNPASGGGNSAAFCAALKAQLTGLGTFFPKDFANAEQVKAYGRFVKSSNQALAVTAPPEIAADVRLIARVSAPSADAYTRGVLPTAADTAALRTPEFRAAAARLSAYGRTRCGINPSALPS